MLCLVVGGTWAGLLFAQGKPLPELLNDSERVICYGDPFSRSKDNNHCFVFVGFWGMPLLAAGDNWGSLTVLHYVGTVKKHRGYSGICEAAYEGDLISGTLYIDDGRISNYLFANGIDEDSSAYCAFKGGQAERLVEAIYARQKVYIRVGGDGAFVTSFGPDTYFEEDWLPTFFEAVRSTTVENVPLDEYSGDLGGLWDGIKRSLGL